MCARRGHLPHGARQDGHRHHNLAHHWQYVTVADLGRVHRHVPHRLDVHHRLWRKGLSVRQSRQHMDDYELGYRELRIARRHHWFLVITLGLTIITGVAGALKTSNSTRPP